MVVSTVLTSGPPTWFTLIAFTFTISAAEVHCALHPPEIALLVAVWSKLFNWISGANIALANSLFETKDLNDETITCGLENNVTEILMDTFSRSGAPKGTQKAHTAHSMVNFFDTKGRQQALCTTRPDSPDGGPYDGEDLRNTIAGCENDLYMEVVVV